MFYFMNWYKQAKTFTKQEMINLGADGYLSFAVLKNIPIEKIKGREPIPSGDYEKGKKITQPVEVVYNKENDEYMLYSGNHRVHQAEINGDTTIPAFVEMEKV